MLFGGSRSGKTFIIIFAIFVRACKERSRHVILRQHFNHVKVSIWLDTMVKVLALAGKASEKAGSAKQASIRYLRAGRSALLQGRFAIAQKSQGGECAQ